MKATLEFTLPEESSEFHHAVDGTNWYLVAWRMHQALLHSRHDGVDDLKTSAVIDTLNDILEDLGLNLDA